MTPRNQKLPVVAVGTHKLATNASYYDNTNTFTEQ